MCNVTHKLLDIGKDVMKLPSQNVQCHSLAIVHRERCDECFYTINVTNKLLVIGKM